MMIMAILRYWWRGHWACVLDVPLLFESSWDLLCGAVIVVGVSDPEVQIQRLLRRDMETTGGKMTREDAERRVRSQMSVREKVERVEACWEGRGENGFVVWNDGSMEELRDKVGEVVMRLRRGRGWWWSRLGVFVPAWLVARMVALVWRNWVRRRRYLEGKRLEGKGR